MIQRLSLLFALLSSVVSIMYFFTQNINYGIIGISLFSAFILLYCILNLRKRFVLLLFDICFFTFLLGKNLICVLDGKDWIGNHTIESAQIMIVLLYISLIGLFLGSLFAEKISGDFSFNNHNQNLVADNHICIEKTSKLFYWISYPANVYAILMKVIYVLRNGYFAYYTTYAGVNVVVSRLQSFNVCALFLFMSTMPTKKSLRPVLVSWLIINLSTIFAGGRATFVTTILLVLYYYYFRDSFGHKNGEIWISSILKKAIIFSIPIGIIFLGAWNYLRVGQSTESGVLGSFLQFFVDQGGSADLICYANEYKQRLPQNMYSLGSLIRFFKYNYISKFITGETIPVSPSIEMATKGYNYASAITYLVMPWNYFAGHGLGSCYIAEVWLDFGYIGVLIFNVLIGVVLSLMSSIRSRKVFCFYIVLHILDAIMLLPRDTALNWLMSILNFNTLISYIFIVFISYGFRSEIRGFVNES